MSGVATLTARFVQEVEGTERGHRRYPQDHPGSARPGKVLGAHGRGPQSPPLPLRRHPDQGESHRRRRGHRRQRWTAPGDEASHVHKVEVETRNLEEVGQALEAGADILLLDNMDLDTLARAVEAVEGRALTEASGGVSLETVAGDRRDGSRFHLRRRSNPFIPGRWTSPCCSSRAARLRAAPFRFAYVEGRP